MKYKAVISFAGLVSMYAGEVKELTDEESVSLLSCGYIEPVEKIKADEKRVEVLAVSEFPTEPPKEEIEEVPEESAKEETEETAVEPVKEVLEKVLTEPKKTPKKNSKK